MSRPRESSHPGNSQTEREREEKREKEEKERGRERETLDWMRWRRGMHIHAMPLRCLINITTN